MMTPRRQSKQPLEAACSSLSEWPALRAPPRGARTQEGEGERAEEGEGEGERVPQGRVHARTRAKARAQGEDDGAMAGWGERARGVRGRDARRGETVRR